MSIYRIQLPNINRLCCSMFYFYSMKDIKRFLSLVPKENVPFYFNSVLAGCKTARKITPDVKSHPKKEDMIYIEVQYTNSIQWVRKNLYVPKNENLKEIALFLISSGEEGADGRYHIESIKEVSEKELILNDYGYYSQKYNKRGRQIFNHNRKTVAIEHGFFRTECEEQLKDFVQNKGRCLFREKRYGVSGLHLKYAENVGSQQYLLVDDGKEVGVGDLNEVIGFLCDENYYDLLDMNNVYERS